MERVEDAARIGEGRRFTGRTVGQKPAVHLQASPMGFTPGPILSPHRFFNPQILDKYKEENDLQKWRNLSLLRLPIKTTLRSLHEGPDTVEELLDHHVVRNRPSTSSVLDEEEEERLAWRRLTSMRREALGLYRDILRATRFFLCTDARGVPWRDVLRENARKELEEARFEKDPEFVTRLLIGRRDVEDWAPERLVGKQRIEQKNSIP